MSNTHVYTEVIAMRRRAVGLSINTFSEILTRLKNVIIFFPKSVPTSSHPSLFIFLISLQQRLNNCLTLAQIAVPSGCHIIKRRRKFLPVLLTNCGVLITVNKVLVLVLSLRASLIVEIRHSGHTPTYVNCFNHKMKFLKLYLRFL